MSLHLDDPRSPLAWPRRRPSLRRRVAELERLLAEVENDAGLAELRAEVRELQAVAHPKVEGLCLAADVDRELRHLNNRLTAVERSQPRLGRHDHEPAVSRLLAGEHGRPGAWVDTDE